MRAPLSDRVAFDLRRRELFRAGAIGTAVLAWSTTAARLAHGQATVAPRTLALDARRAQVLDAIAAAMYPEGQSRPGARGLGLLQRIDEELYFAQPRLREQLDLALDAIEYGSLLLGWWGRFTRLPEARRLAALEGMFTHPLTLVREIAAGVTQIIKAFYYADDRTWASIGYDGPWVPRKRGPTHDHYVAQLREGAQP